MITSVVEALDTVPLHQTTPKATRAGPNECNRPLLTFSFVRAPFRSGPPPRLRDHKRKEVLPNFRSWGHIARGTVYWGFTQPSAVLNLREGRRHTRTNLMVTTRRTAHISLVTIPGSSTTLQAKTFLGCLPYLMDRNC